MTRIAPSMIVLASALLAVSLVEHSSSFVIKPLDSIATISSRRYKRHVVVWASKDDEETPSEPPPISSFSEPAEEEVLEAPIASFSEEVEEEVILPPPVEETPPPVVETPRAPVAAAMSEGMTGMGNLPGGISMPEMPEMDFSAVTELVKDIDLDEFAASAQAGLNNLISTENIGKRGELYTVGQFALIGAVLFGGIPVVGDLLFLLLGPATMVGGLGLTIASVGNMGNALSPWPTPAKGGKLVTTGLYEKMRHPMYTGLICTLLGYSILLSSAPRLILTGLLWAFLNAKADEEEKYLKEAYPEYEAYMAKVDGKFIPSDLVSQATKLLPGSND